MWVGMYMRTCVCMCAYMYMDVCVHVCIWMCACVIYILHNKSHGIGKQYEFKVVVIYFDLVAYGEFVIGGGGGWDHGSPCS